MKKKADKKTIIFAGILVLVVYLFREELAEALGEMRHISPAAAVTILLLSMGYQLAEGRNLTAVVRLKDPGFTQWEGFAGMLYTSFFRVATFGSAPAAATAVYLAKRGIPAATGTGISAILYMIHKLVIALVCVLCLILRFNSLGNLYREYFGYLLLSLCLIVVIAGVLLFLCFGGRLHGTLIRLLRRMDRKRAHTEAIDALEEQLLGLRTFSAMVLKDRRTVAELVILNIGKFLCWYLIPWVLLRDEIWLGVADTVAVMAFVTAVAGVLPAPAGIGSTEFAFLLLFRGLASDARLLSCALVYRFVTYILPGLLGGVEILGSLLKKNHRKRTGKR
ncbi:MAG: lysylphosphatidylglycerol synthase transmembrane domain-containing protein [Lachnospiraceae bacterium]|nr:lysylphosphatidylglycerol synthase transmembrane domain-containing protein [Lachnospiraceae bacterium]